jgi:murein DD-endopeptidase MepM/ murein hydrolase activator NlpD
VGLGLLLALVGVCWADDSANSQILSENFPGQIVILEPADLYIDSAATQTEKETAKEQRPKEQTEQARYRVAPGDNLRKIAKRYQVEWTALAEANALADQDFIRVGQVLIIPQAGDSAVAASAASAKPDRYPWPVTGSITQHYGGRHDAFHHGLDIAAPAGTPITALDSGVVTWAGRKSIYGLCVIIDHGQGRKTLYGHASKLLVQKGNTVNAGQTIAEIGSTGRSTGPHLHLEIYDNGKTVNPLAFLE